MLCAEVSLYPQKTTQASEIINTSVQSLAKHGVNFEVGSISTHLHGTDEQVWSALRSMFDLAKDKSEVSMVVTLSNAAH
ncbi:MAG: hypothetical protein PWP65_693 [Clostridia bacterium]|nr:hypothetical protein [Clostridia bacterium]